MQTFLPYPDFQKSAHCLDYRRLGKQRVEAHQILNILLNRTDKRGWQNHPVVKLWYGYECALKSYYNYMLKEWELRGYKNNMKYESVCANFCIPSWFGRDDFHSAHRAALLYKLPNWYSQFGWMEKPKIEYVWN